MDSNPGVRLGGAEVQDPDQLMATAVRLASEADAVIAVVGLNADWETEGYDRTTLALPQRTDEFVSLVAKANPRTIVVTQSGSSITMPWADEVPAIVHAWYLGNATGEAIGDVLTGKVNPSGRLSLTFAKRLEDYASHGHFNSENGKVRHLALCLVFPLNTIFVPAGSLRRRPLCGASVGVVVHTSPADADLLAYHRATNTSTTERSPHSSISGMLCGYRTDALTDSRNVLDSVFRTPTSSTPT